MKKLIFSLLLFALLPAVTFAQAKEKNAWGYAHAGIVGKDRETGLMIGAGTEVVTRQGIGGGAEFALAEGGLFVCVNGVYHFKNQASKKLRPFVTGGYTTVINLYDKTRNGGNFGGGVQYWFSKRVGLRVELRGHLLSDSSRNFYNLRFGVSFR